ncbi:MAG: cytochrome c maturation protein CcmE [Bacteroidota bacterium]
MKKSHIFGIVVIAVAVAILMSTAIDASTYSTFQKAKEMAVDGNDSKIHVVGTLKKDHFGEVVGVTKGADKLSFSFVMVDQDSLEQIVYYNEPMPTDFLRSDQVVVVGNYREDLFVADKILMKCPSKYTEETIEAQL